MTTYAIVQTEHSFYYYDSNGWQSVPFCPIVLMPTKPGKGSQRVCFLLWRSPRNETETSQIVAGFNFKDYGK